MAVQPVSSLDVTSLLYRSPTFHCLDQSDDNSDHTKFERQLFSAGTSLSCWRGDNGCRTHQQLTCGTGSLGVIIEEPSDPTEWNDGLSRMISSEEFQSSANGFLSNEQVVLAAEETASSLRSRVTKRTSAGGIPRAKKPSSKAARKRKAKLAAGQTDPCCASFEHSSAEKAIEPAEERASGLANIHLNDFGTSPHMDSSKEMKYVEARSDTELKDSALDESPSKQRRSSDSFLSNDAYPNIHSVKADDPRGMQNGCSEEEVIQTDSRDISTAAVWDKSDVHIASNPQVDGSNVNLPIGEAVEKDAPKSDMITTCSDADGVEEGKEPKESVSDASAPLCNDSCHAKGADNSSDVKAQQKNVSIVTVIVSTTTTKTVRRVMPTDAAPEQTPTEASDAPMIEEPVLQVSDQSMLHSMAPGRDALLLSNDTSANRTFADKYDVSIHIQSDKQRCNQKDGPDSRPKPANHLDLDEECIIVGENGISSAAGVATDNSYTYSHKPSNQTDIAEARYSGSYRCSSSVRSSQSTGPLSTSAGIHPIHHSSSTISESELVAQIVYDTFYASVSREKFFKRLFPPSYYDSFSREYKDTAADTPKKKEKGENEVNKTNADVIEVLLAANPKPNSTAHDDNDVGAKWRRGARRSKASRFFHNLWHSLSKQLHGS